MRYIRRISNRASSVSRRIYPFTAKLSLACLSCFLCLCGFGQEPEEEPFEPMIRVALTTANAHIPSATVGGVSMAIVPAWGGDVDYFFHERWSVSIQADVKLQSFEVEDGEILLERSNPFSLAGVMHYHALRHWSFFAGPGYEFDSNGNLFFVKLGTEYSFEVTETFEIALVLSYENKDEIYDVISFGVAFNKRLWVKK